MLKKHYFSSLAQAVCLAVTLSFFTARAQGQPTKALQPQQADVYLAGFTRQEGKPIVATYLKNGQPVVLASSETDSEISSMAVFGNNVYAAGSHGGKAVYWQNGEEVVLTGRNPGRVDAISVDERNGDVYMVGYERVLKDENSPGPRSSTDRARCWRNGRLVPLAISNHPFDDSYASGVAVDNSTGDVYVVGGGQVNGNQKYMYWKNGGLVEIIGDPKLYAPSVIKIANNDVYILGLYNAMYLAYWCGAKGMVVVGKNAGNISSIKPASIGILGSDVYVTGNESDGLSKYWKNGVETQLAPPPLAYESKIAVCGNDVYIAGVGGEPGKPSSRLWKNGQLVQVFEGEDKIAIQDIVVVKAAGNKQSPAPAGAAAQKAKQPPVATPVATGNTPAAATTSTPAATQEYEDNIRFLADNKTKPGIVTTASGLQYQALVAGTPAGPKPAMGDKVKYQYSLTTVTGGKIQDSYKPQNPTTLAVKDVLPGLAEGLMLMTVDSKYKFFLPPKLGRGKTLANGAPNNSTLIFEVELLEVIPGQGTAPASNQTTATPTVSTPAGYTVNYAALILGKWARTHLKNTLGVDDDQPVENPPLYITEYKANGELIHWEEGESDFASMGYYWSISGNILTSKWARGKPVQEEILVLDDTKLVTKVNWSADGKQYAIETFKRVK